MLNAVKNLTLVAAVLTTLGSGAAVEADRVSGRLTGTYVIVEDTDLVGDVVCDVPNNTPCFSFGAPGVELRLNGHTMTGKGDPVVGCGGVVFANEFGVTTNGQPRVRVRGPGLIQRFRHHGVQVAASMEARIEDLIASTNCGSGIHVIATSFGTLVQANTSVRNGSAMPGQTCGGI